MLIDLSAWFDGTVRSTNDYIAVLQQQERARRKNVLRIISDLATVGEDLGLSQSNVEGKVRDLFNTFAAEWSIYLLAGADDIVPAIQNDVSLTWLDTEYPPGSGVTLRQRFVNRIS